MNHTTTRTAGPDATAQPGRDSPLDVTVVLPCYNEAAHVQTEIDRICAALDAAGYRYELLAIDDASTDATLDVLRMAELSRPQVKVVALHRNSGAGTARRVGTRMARGDIVVWTDADLTYPNERIPELVGMLREDASVDQVVGSRTSEQGSHRLLRIPAKWVIRKIAEWLVGQPIPDLNSGLRAFRRSVAAPYLRLLPPGFSCVTTITMAFLSNQHDIAYLPIDYGKRAGKSKFRFVTDAYRYLLQVLRMVMYFNPLKALMPLTLALLGLGVAKSIFDVTVHPLRLATNTIMVFLTGLIIGSLALLADLIVRSRPDV
ncbi:glycosyltransferase family 2 protein [Dactylosporangium sp. NPDC005572]|uniref:glycosyltransferase family 2 protein n=1 Tax=Dactylosporangium sp. NPDC005572 TaxID=3156889 RepID=UPI0033A143F9